ncbi:TetR/AcrR family transcriptional regulator [Caldilinea sp.]|uniref:TetR/AcrR family transcriptional regulator n=1 Tax=Caldilinea sp. TaxID=2293560 RepID=UPI002C87E5D5|nr:TetR/AcrR family transcriptional regulator [Caldilinea sp.]
MPRPRFDKLSPQKRAAILEAAAREFAGHGYDNASMNKILDAAQLSKGAAYYYFDDKADLFAATVQYYAGELIGDLDSLVDGLTAELFWATFSEMYVAQFDFFYDRPWAFGAIKAAGRLAEADLAKHPRLAASLGAVQQGVIKLIRQGQQLGVVRTDLPDDLLAALLIGVDDASDRWLLAHWETLSKEELLTIIRRVVAGLSRMLG